jgi:hypothetical protein
VINLINEMCKIKNKYRRVLIFFISSIVIANNSKAQSAGKTEGDDAAVIGLSPVDTLSNNATGIGIVPPDALKSIGITNDDASLQGEIESGLLKVASKKYSKTYTAGKLDELLINNRFGEVKINTWNNKEFKVEVQVNIYADSQADAQRFLGAVNVNDSRRDARVSFKTLIGDNGGDADVLWKGKDKPHIKKIEVSYVVFMPAINALSINNSYGTTILPDFAGKLYVNSLYGNLKAKKIVNPLNSIKVNFGDADIDGFSGAKLEINHGSLDLAEGNDLNVSVTYGNVRLGKIYASANINVRFSKQFRIDNIDRNIKALNVNAAYTTLQVGNITGVNANFNITTHYGALKSNDPYITLANNSTKGDTSPDIAAKSYTGRLGKGNANRNIVIKTNFGQVNFD